MASNIIRNKVYISYSHKDKNGLKVYKGCSVRILEGMNTLIWADTKIKPGDLWKVEIANAFGDMYKQWIEEKEKLGFALNSVFFMQKTRIQHFEGGTIEF